MKPIKLIGKIIFIIFVVIIIPIIALMEFLFFELAYYKGTPENHKFDESAIDNIWFEENKNIISIKSNDGLTLYANEFKNEKTNDWVIISHGIGSMGKKMAKYGIQFYNKGYNVLILELRGNGISEGDHFTYGYDDKKDVLQWIDYIINNNENSKIILFGSSMGAATSILVSGENIPSNITHIIADSGYSSLQDELEYYIKEKASLPTFPLLNIFNIITKIKLGYFCDEISPMDAVKNSETPTLFIHGKKDNLVPFYMLDRNYNNAKCPKEKIEVENAGHMQSIHILGPEKYFENIFNFIEKY